MLILNANKSWIAQKSKRASVFDALLITNVLACGSDALSWLLDGYVRLGSVVYCSTFLAVLLTIVLIWEFLVYLLTYIKERKTISPAWGIIANRITLIAGVTTVVLSLNGSLFTVRDAVYADSPLYGLYVAINILMLVYAVTVISSLRKVLTVTDRIASYAHVLIPFLAAAVNLFVEDWSFAYPATALTLLLVYVMIQSDALDRLEHEGRIVSYHATHDEMTGLCNRRAFEDRRAVLKEADGTCGVVFGNLNGLKYTNDHYGHEVGDQLLICFAEILTGIFRQNEVFRISGDEFVCMMENINETIFTQRSKQLEEALRCDARPLASIGTAFGTSRDLDALIRDAESNMYIEKEAFHAQFPDTKR